MLLPAKANNGAEDTRGQVSRLIAADDRGDGTKRFLAATIRALSPTQDRADPVYVHAKVAVIDDRWLIVGSANLNAHSLFNDTEMCVVTDDAALARDTRVRLWAEHLELDEADVRAAEPGHAGGRALAPDRRRAARTPARRICPPPTGCWSFRGRRGGRRGCWARSTGCSPTDDRATPAVHGRLT